jgi:MFS family permease
VRAALADRRPLRIPAYRRWWATSLVTAVGGWFSVVAVPVQLYATTGSSAAIGGAAVMSFAGLITGTLAAGTLADRHDRRSVLLWAQVASAAAYLGLWAHATLDGPPAVLLILVAGQGLTLGAISTVAAAVLPRLVPAELLVAANSLNSLVRYGGSILGPILAGLLIPVAGLEMLYLCDAAALLAVLWAVLHLPVMPPSLRHVHQDPAPRADHGRCGDHLGTHGGPVRPGRPHRAGPGGAGAGWRGQLRPEHAPLRDHPGAHRRRRPRPCAGRPHRGAVRWPAVGEPSPRGRRCPVRPTPVIIAGGLLTMMTVAGVLRAAPALRTLEAA